MKGTIGITLGDIVLIALSAASALALFIVLPVWVTAGGNTVVITVDGETRARYRLDSNRTIKVPGPVGDTVVVIQDGKAFVSESACPNKLCTRMGSIGKEGGIIVCVPNKVTVSVEGAESSAVDAISR
jgi:hypothetical protein